MAKTKNYFRQLVRHGFHDVRLAGLLVFLVIVLLISWSGVKVIQSNYALQQQIARLQQENQVQALKNENLKLQNEYLSSDQYLELSARQDLGLGAPGETELLVPKSVALAHIVNVPTASSNIPQPDAHQPFWQKNLQAWIDFYLHRPGAE